jgi:hypothetical protein
MNAESRQDTTPDELFRPRHSGGRAVVERVIQRAHPMLRARFAGGISMITKLLDAMFNPKYPRGYTGRHRAEFAPVRAGRPARTRPLTGRESLTAL